MKENIALFMAIGGATLVGYLFGVRDERIENLKKDVKIATKFGEFVGSVKALSNETEVKKEKETE